MLCTLVDLELGQLRLAHPIARDHALDCLADDFLGVSSELPELTQEQLDRVAELARMLQR